MIVAGRHIVRFLWLWLAAALAWASPANAATCSPAAMQGAAPPAWQTYCWLDFSTYVSATARSAVGQDFLYTLTDGSILTFNVKATAGTAPAINAIVAPSWTGAAVGNTAFLGIPGKPVLYTAAAGTVTITISSISITPPPGAPAVTSYAFVAADAESTNQGESLSFVTNGSGWTILDKVDPISGALFPTISGTGTTTFTETGVAGTVGGYIVGSTSPTTVTTTLVAGGLQGAMFAVRFASMRLNKQITGARIDAADQFTFRITASSSGSTLATGTSTGTGNGPFTAAAVSLASGLPLTISEGMATGSVSTLPLYDSRLTCVNGTSGSTTALPTNVATTSYSFGSLQFGDAIQCSFTNAAFPRISLAKALGGTRVFPLDQFGLSVKLAAATVATGTTTGTGSAITGGNIASTQVTSGSSYTLAEAESGSTVLGYYNTTLSCSNGATSSTTTLPTAVPGTVTPVLGDIVTCTITNTPKSPAVSLVIVKSSAIISDPVNGTTNPKAIPGALVRYTITVTNTGTAPVDASSAATPTPLIVIDPLPTTLRFYGAGASPVQFVDGTPASGVAYNYTNNVTYSRAVGGGAPYNTPAAVPLVLDGNGYDGSITGIRVTPTSQMTGATAAGQPSFSVTFLTQIR
jgi:hypothetical protein